MITLLKRGNYKLVETEGQIKILSLDDKKEFAWISAQPIGEILVSTHKPHKIDHVLAVGNYRLYDVKDELNLTDLYHLELFVGDGKWQGYLLPIGLPNGVKKRRIISTNELITQSVN